MSIIGTIIFSLAIYTIGDLVAAMNRNQFCQDLSKLEAHLNTEPTTTEILGIVYVGNYECTCSEADPQDLSFYVDCEEYAMVQGENHNIRQKTLFGFEQMMFSLTNGEGEYSLRHTSWGFEKDFPEDMTFLDKGNITSCKANACTSCTVCDDKKTIAMDCSNTYESNYTVDCNVGYTGPLANTFNFGVITSDEGMPTVSTNIDNVGFCDTLFDLESHMDHNFQIMMAETYTKSHECSCDSIDSDSKSFTVNCFLEVHDGFGYTLWNSEEMVFVPNNQGEYELSKSTWWYDVIDPDGVFYMSDEEEFDMEKGVITRCKVSGCKSCVVCSDKESLSLDCSNLEQGSGYKYECDEGYTGAAAAITFVFENISPPLRDEPSSTSPATTPAATEPPETVETKNNAGSSNMMCLYALLPSVIFTMYK